ncbi:MAG: cytochrome c peroxidase [Candidatus Zixiibacteriota bacterium]
MFKIKARLIPAVFLILFVFAGNMHAQVPITAVRAHSLGPEQIGNLTPVIEPPDNPQTVDKILLGKKLYFDTRLSADNSVSCATCHDPAMGWSDAGPTSKGINNQLGGRRAPPVSNSAYNLLQFWDGRSPSLEDQAKGPIANPIEMGNTHVAMIRTVNDIPGYVEEFKQVFGSSPITVDQVAQAIAAFERTVVTTDSPFDRYVRGDLEALTPLEKKGLEIFNGKGHCTACHWGGHFSDGRFHNLGVAHTDPSNKDEGRFKVTNNPLDMGAFKTPTVRDAALRAPFMHDGSEKTLEDVVRLYDRGGGPDKANLDPLMVPLDLSENEVQALVAFMKRAMVSTNPEVSNVKPIPASELPK